MNYLYVKIVLSKFKKKKWAEGRQMKSLFIEKIFIDNVNGVRKWGNTFHEAGKYDAKF